MSTHLWSDLIHGEHRKYNSWRETEGFECWKCRSLSSLTTVSCVARLVALRQAMSLSLIANFKNETTASRQNWRHVVTVIRGRHWKWQSMLKNCLTPWPRRALMFSQQSCLASGRTDLRRRQICSTCNTELPEIVLENFVSADCRFHFLLLDTETIVTVYLCEFCRYAMHRDCCNISVIYANDVMIKKQFFIVWYSLLFNWLYF